MSCQYQVYRHPQKNFSVRSGISSLVGTCAFDHFTPRRVPVVFSIVHCIPSYDSHRKVVFSWRLETLSMSPQGKGSEEKGWPPWKKWIFEGPSTQFDATFCAFSKVRFLKNFDIIFERLDKFFILILPQPYCTRARQSAWTQLRTKNWSKLWAGHLRMICSAYKMFNQGAVSSHSYLV